MYWLLYLTLITLVVNFFFAILIVFFERRSPVSTLAWILILFFIPIVGLILYAFFGQNLRKKKKFKKKEKKDKFQRDIYRQEVLLDNHNDGFINLEMPQLEDMIRLNLIGADSLYTQNNYVEIYTTGKEKFEALLTSLESAESYIHLEYYIFRNDIIGKQILKILEQKAKNGVEVKFLYDGIGGISLPNHVFKKLKQNGGKVACFFPSFVPYLYLRVNYRNHRKIALIDGREAFVGGFNIGDEYLGRSKVFGFWRDTHIKIKGDGINSLQRQFILDWNFAAKDNISFSKKYFPIRKLEKNIAMQIVASGPDSTWTSIKDGYFKMITSACTNIYVQTPYFIPDESIFQALKVAALSGLDVKIIIPNKPDQPFVHWASYSYIGELLNSGVRCYSYKKGFIHSKTIVIDSLISSIGTANVDVRSFNLNFEINAFIYDQNIAKKMEQIFLTDIEDSEEITLETYNNRSLKIKSKESISRLLSPIL
ncbi:MAG: cardiolipin synthase [Candidatus Sericytochromatia bacterium]|nr:cardiolipin synthase [Candidatus Sericytochromatia bacterium]